MLSRHALVMVLVFVLVGSQGCSEESGEPAGSSGAGSHEGRDYAGSLIRLTYTPDRQAAMQKFRAILDRKREAGEMLDQGDIHRIASWAGISDDSPSMVYLNIFGRHEHRVYHYRMEADELIDSAMFQFYGEIIGDGPVPVFPRERLEAELAELGDRYSIASDSPEATIVNFQLTMWAEALSDGLEIRRDINRYSDMLVGSEFNDSGQ